MDIEKLERLVLAYGGDSSEMPTAEIMAATRAAIKAAVEAEREACAAICQSRADDAWKDYQDMELSDDLEGVVKSIRARAQS